MLSTVAVRGYRSLRELVLPLARLTVVSGGNGTGKSSVYRALRLLAACGRGDVVGSLAREGGLASARWAGAGTAGRPAELLLGYAADDVGYLVDLGLPVPSRSLFDRDPVIAREVVFAGPTPRPAATLVSREGPLVRRTRETGRGMAVLGAALATHDSILTEFGHPDDTPELTAVRHRLRGWRFYDGFRVDAGAPARRPQVGTRTAALADDGADLAAAWRTIQEVGPDADVLARTVADAFGGAQVSVEAVDGLFDLQVRQPGMTRPLRAAELSDGTLRFLLWATALLAPRPPSLMVVNEPETSLHPDLLGPLAMLVATAAQRSQVLLVTHSTALTASLAAPAAGGTHDVLRLELVKDRDGGTRVDGAGPLDAPTWDWGRR